MRKKFLAVLAAGSMAASLAACGNSGKNAPSDAPTKTEATATTEATTVAKATEESTTAKETEAASTEEAATEAASTEEATTEAATEAASAEEATTEEATEAASTEEATTEAASTEEATTEAASTEEATTEEATTEAASTEEETTEAKTTEEETTEAKSFEEESSEAVTAEAESTEAETEEQIDGTGFKIGMVTDVGGVNDGSFNQSAWAGLQKAQDDFGCEVLYLESKTDSDYAPNIDTLIDEDCDLIVITGYMLASALNEAAEMNPDQKFVIIDDASNADFDNVTCLMFEQAQASYLVGLAAGYTTKTNVVGFVLGMENETMNQFGYGYCAGVLDANPDAKILQYNANAFGDTAGGKSAAVNMITNDADVIFHAAGGTGLGVIDGCKENKIWAIGVDSDQSVIAPETVLTSAMKRVDNACYDACKEIITGTLEPGLKTYDLAMGGVDIAPTTDNLDEDVLAKIEEAKKAIIDGDVVVPKTKDEFEEKYGDVYELDAE